MRRGRGIAIGVATAVAVAMVGTGAAYGVLALTDFTPSAGSDAKQPAASPATTSSDVAEAPTVVAKPEPKPVLEPGDTGMKVRELQSRLKQLAWYAPDINGRYDTVTARSVKGFQQKRGFEKTGIVDKRTWRRIITMSRMPTDDEMHNRLTPGPTILGPGATGMEVRELQARLKQIGWLYGDVTDYYGDETTTAVAGFQTKREIPSTGEVDQRTMDRLVEMTHEPTRDELFNRYIEPVAGALDPRCETGRVLCIDKSTNSLRWVIDGEVLTSVDVRFGSDELPTREGEFSVTYKSRDHVSSLYETSMPYAMFFSGGQAVHYSPDFAANGYNGASHGCVNVRDYEAIQSLFDQVDVGDTVIVYWS
jgi:peptidoglycan hydrolase-like protein with peptidoglycan-binding domain